MDPQLQIEKLLGRAPSLLEKRLAEIIRDRKWKWVHLWPQVSRVLVPSEGLLPARCPLTAQAHRLPIEGEAPHGFNLAKLNASLFERGAEPLARLGVLGAGPQEEAATQEQIHLWLERVGEWGAASQVPFLGGQLHLASALSQRPFTTVFSMLEVQPEAPEPAQGDGGGPYTLYHLGASTRPLSRSLAEHELLSKDPTQAIASYDVELSQELMLMEAVAEAQEKRLLRRVRAIAKGGAGYALFRLCETEGVGLEAMLHRLPMAAKEMGAEDLLLAENSGRLLALVRPDKQHELEEVFQKRGLNARPFGQTDDQRTLRVWHGQEQVCALPITTALYQGPRLPWSEQTAVPAKMALQSQYDMASLPEVKDLKHAAYSLIKNPNVLSKNWLNHLLKNQPDQDGQAVLLSEVWAFEHGGCRWAATTTSNFRYAEADPAIGCQILVAEAVRKLACAGVRPQGMAMSLHLGDRDNPEVRWQFGQAVHGLESIAARFELPVHELDVDFQPNPGTGLEEPPLVPVVCVWGSVETDKPLTTSFQAKGHMIFLLGESKEDLACSEHLNSFLKVKHSPPPYFDAQEAVRLSELLPQLVERSLLASAHSVSAGGLFTCLMESCVSSDQGLGFDLTMDAEIRPDSFLFGESQNRVVVSVPQDKETEFIDFMIDARFPFSTLGHVTRGEMRVDDKSFGFTHHALKHYQNARRRHHS